MLQRLVVLLSMTMLVVCLPAAPAAPEARVTLSDTGSLSWRIGDTVLGTSGDWLQVRDVTAGDAFVPVPVEPGVVAGGFTGSIQGLVFRGRWGGDSRLGLEVEAEPPVDRALVIRIALPLRAVGWTWWDDINRKRPIEAGKQYSYLLTWNWKSPRQVSAYPFCAVSGPDVGVSVGVPLSKPRVFRLAYDATTLTLNADFDIGLSPETAKFPARADLDVFCYAHDPVWGFRSATDGYYHGRHGQGGERRVREGGIWLLSFKPETMACPWDWGLRFDEGGQGHAGYDVAHDIAPLVYTEPWGIYEGFGNKPPPDGKDRYGRNVYLLAAAEMRQFIHDKLQAPPEQKFWGPVTRREAAQAEINSAITDQNGEWIWSHYTQTWSKGNFLANVCLNPDPDLPAPSRASVTWDGEIKPAFETAKRAGGQLGGVYLDSVCGYVGFFDENYRREHWKYSDIPLVVSHSTKKPVQLHAFSCFELAAQIAREIRVHAALGDADGNPRSKPRWDAPERIVIGNTGRPEMAWFCPLLDMIGTGEHGSGLQADEHYNYMRVHGYHKPMSPMAYDLVDPAKSWAEKERAMHRMLFYAVHPGTGPFDDATKYEPARPLYRVYEQFIIWMDQARWRPVTLARVDQQQVLVERYGPTWKGDRFEGLTFLALRNISHEPVQAQLEVEQGALAPALRGRRWNGELPVTAWLLLADRPAALAANPERTLTLAVPLPPDSTEVVALGSTETMAGLWLTEAQNWLERLAKEGRWLGANRGKVIVNGDFESGLNGWGQAVPPNNQRDSSITVETQQPLAGKSSAKAQSQNEDSHHALNLNPPVISGEEYTLRFKYAWTLPAGARGTLTPRFGIKGADGEWAPKEYIYFKDVQPTGGATATFERRFTVRQGLSAGFFQLMFDGNWGTILVDDVELISQRLVESDSRLTALPAAAELALGELRAALEHAGQKRDRLLSAAVAQEPVAQRLLDLAQGVSEAHSRRCLVLPVRNFQVALGQALEILTGVTAHAPASPAFGDAANGLAAALPCAVTAHQRKIGNLTVAVEGIAASAVGSLAAGATSTSTLAVPAPVTEPGGWADVFFTARFEYGGRKIWMPRRTTLRLHTPLEANIASGIGGCSRSIDATVLAWLPGQTRVELGGRLEAGSLAADVPAVPVAVEMGKSSAIRLPLPETIAARCEELAATGATGRFAWIAKAGAESAQKGVAEIEFLRGAQCPRLAPGVEVVVDGRIQDGEWQNAAVLTGFVRAADTTPAARQTTVRLTHDGTRLYLAFTCSGQPRTTASNRTHDGNLWEDDSIEFYLQPPGRESYFQLIVNTAGAQFESECRGGAGTAWNPKWDAKTNAGGDAWTAEVAIPLAALGGALPGTWRANFCRNEADTKQASCWAPVQGAFHTPDRFGQIEFR